MITYYGSAFYAEGCSIVNTGKIYFGKNFSANKNCFFNCCEEIKIGENVLLGWDITIIDGDGHSLIEGAERKQMSKKIEIDDHTWISAESSILKGSKISRDSIVGYGSLVSGEFNESNILIAGIPAKCIKRNINWKK